MARAFSEIAFTPSVRAEQERLGSARMYDRFLLPEAEGANRFTDVEAAFIAARDGFFQATVSETGWPYVQFRGGPAGFVKALDETTLAYADFRGNRQYVSLGNLRKDTRVSLIMVDYPNRRRIKIMGHARTVEIADNPELVDQLMVLGYKAKPERAVLIDLEGFDWNCPAHIPERFTLEELRTHLGPVQQELARLTAENEALKAALDGRDEPR
ncbi:MAG: pyridoxamine 5'-phosphate oxidase family protein [Pseudomonadota bacterium]